MNNFEWELLGKYCVWKADRLGRGRRRRGVLYEVTLPQFPQERIKNRLKMKGGKL